MAVKFFGQYLVEQGIVTIDALLEAITLQKQKQLRLGEVAVEMGLITVADIERVHNAQISGNMRFGDLLVEMGLLTPAQLNDVLTRQKSTHLYIGDALIQIGALKDLSLKSHLESFKAYQAGHVSTDIELPVKTGNDRIWEITLELIYKIGATVLGLEFKPGKCVPVTVVMPNFILVSIDLNGDLNASFIVSITEALQKTIARAMLAEDCIDDEPAEIMEDTVMEFVNIVCGNMAAKTSQMGVIVDVTPPVIIHPPATGMPIPEGHSALSFMMQIEGGDTMELILLIRE